MFKEDLERDHAVQLTGSAGRVLFISIKRGFNDIF